MLSAQPKGDSINLNDSKAIVDFSSMNSLENTDTKRTITWKQDKIGLYILEGINLNDTTKVIKTTSKNYK
jgi:hypothetical protein